MTVMKKTILLFVSAFFPLLLSAQNISADSIEVDGVMRKMLIYSPEVSGPRPLVFVFHGRTGTMERAVKKFAFHRAWPEAVVVFPQGLWIPNPGKVGPGWGWRRPDADGNGRDLKFFDRLLEYVKGKFEIDGNRIYCFGQSNGGGFTYALWAFRGDVFAAVAPTNANNGRGGYVKEMLKPKPCFMLAGEKDQIVEYDISVRTSEYIRKLNGCGKGKVLQPNLTFYKGRNGCDMETYFHGGGHPYPQVCTDLIVDFFKKHPKRK